MKHVPLIGPHISIAGGLHNALLTGKEIGATTVQIFTANQRTWYTKNVSEEEAALFRKTLAKTGLSHIMSHGSYLINLGSPRPDVYEKSLMEFRKEIERCIALGITYLNFHPGASLDSPVEEALEKVVQALLSMADCFEKPTKLRLLAENMAGQGSVLGARFEQLGYLVDRLKDTIPIGVCMDTCHTFVAGYDIRTEKALTETLKEFNAVVGLKHLKALHLNDSVFDLGSHKDRHAPIGEGKIGKGGFSAIMKEPHLASLPKYLETPGGLDVWQQEITWLRRQIP
jgi:deoxyribonuclease-4